MKKKIKLGLNGLQVKSFITSIHPDESEAIKGGTELSCTQQCDTLLRTCIVTRHNQCPTEVPTQCPILTRPQECQITLLQGC